MNDKPASADSAVNAKSVEAASEDCGCAPTPAEARAFWNNAPLSRRHALGLGALSAVALSAFGITGGVSAAYAASYPSWDDVQRAKANESAKATEITRIQGLIDALTQKVADTQAAAEVAGQAFFEAQQAYFDQATKADELQAKADVQAATADEAERKAAQVATQLYRDGGDDTSLELFFSGSSDDADELLSRLGTMDKVYDYTQTIYDTATAARDASQALSDQAVVARDERDRLQKIAEQKLIEAQAAADAAQQALDEQTTNLATMQAQLAALKDTTATTVAAYKEGVRVAEEKRKAAEAAAAAAAAKSGGTGGTPGTGGWVRPHGGYRSSNYGPRVAPCSGCSTFHRGVDLANGCGAPIYAAHSGTVDAAFYNGGYGNYIRIQHGGGVGTGYGHIRPGGFAVSAGQNVSAGQIIAYAGTTGSSNGCHLHFEVYINGATTNPVTFLAARGISV
ncbi:MAG: peptidoglycan DD-metalloendopeptidase family protein [Microbacterium sp.]